MHCLRVILIGVVAASVCGIACAQVSPSFEVTVVRPARPDATGMDWDVTNNRTVIRNISLVELIRNAYMLKTPLQVLGPEWIRSAKYDVTAKTGDEESRREERLKGDERNRAYGELLQSLLKERFGLNATEETRSLPEYALVVDGASTKMAGNVSKPHPEGRHVSGGRGTMTVQGLSMDNLAEILSGRYEVGERTVANKTGLQGTYDFKLEWAPDDGGGIAADATLPGLLEALREQLGLRLVKEMGDVPVVVVKEVKRPEFD